MSCAWNASTNLLANKCITYIIYYNILLNLLPNTFILSVDAIFSGIFFYRDRNYVMHSILNISSFVYELNDVNLKQKHFEEQTHFFLTNYMMMMMSITIFFFYKRSYFIFID